VTEHFRQLDQSLGSLCNTLDVLAGPTQVTLVGVRYQDDPGLLEQCLSVLTPAEQSRSTQLGAPGARSRFIQRRALGHWLAQVVGNFDGLGNPSGTDRNTATGLGDVTHYSVTSTACSAIYALSQDSPVGIDAEPPDPTAPVLDLAKTHFSPAETAALASLPPGKQIDEFFRMWRLKEACLKFQGQGLSNGLDRWCLLRDPQGHLWLENKQPADLSTVAFKPALYETTFMGLALGLVVAARLGDVNPSRTATAIPLDPPRNSAASNVPGLLERRRQSLPGLSPPPDPAHTPNPVRSHKTGS